MSGKTKKMKKYTNDGKNNKKKKTKFNSNKSKLLNPQTSPTYPVYSKPTLSNKSDIRNKNMIIDGSVRDICHLKGNDLIAKSTTILVEIALQKEDIKKGNSEKNINKELDTTQSPKVLDGLMERLVEMRTNYDESLQTVKSLGYLMKEISSDFKAISKAMNDNVYFLHHSTIQKFHALENREKKMLKKYHVIEYMVKKFGDELEKTRKSFNVIRSK